MFRRIVAALVLLLASQAAALAQADTNVTFDSDNRRVPIFTLMCRTGVGNAAVPCNNTYPLPVSVVSGGGGGGTVTGSSEQDVRASGTMAAATVGATYVVPVNGQGTVGFRVSGLTASGATLVFDQSIDGGTTWTQINEVNAGTGVITTSRNTDGQWRLGASGRTHIRLRVSVAGTGTISVASSATVREALVTLVSPLPNGTNTIGTVNLPDALVPTGAPFSASANGVTLFSVETTGYNSISVQTTGTFVATVTYEASNDNTNWVAAVGYTVGNSGTAAPTSIASGQEIRTFPTPGRYFRARTTAYTSGTVVVSPVLRSNPLEPLGMYVGGSATDGTVGDTAWAGSGNATIIAALKGLYNAMIAPTPAGTNNIGSVNVNTFAGTAAAMSNGALAPPVAPSGKITQTSVSLTANTSTTLVAANTNRVGMEIQCDGAAPVGVDRTGAALTSPTAAPLVIPAGSYPLYTMPIASTTAITGYTATAQACRVTEYIR